MISEILSQGAGNARTGRELCRVLDITARELTAAVERERRQGQPICASTGRTPGYFLAETQEEMQQYCTSLKHREKEIGRTRRACARTIKALPAVPEQ